MGSDSDWPVMKAAAEACDEFGVGFEADVVSAHRMPDEMLAYGRDAAGQFADEAVAIGAKAVWFQLGVVDHDAFRRTTEAGVPMVMDTCPAMEWPALG